jgi:hypothetical protein
VTYLRRYDLRELFGTFGRVAQVYVGRDQETGAGKGFAFVSFGCRHLFVVLFHLSRHDVLAF